MHLLWGKVVIAGFFIGLSVFVGSLSAIEEGNVEREKIEFSVPSVPYNAFFYMYFTSPSDLTERFMISKAKKEGVDEIISKYDGVWSVEVPYSSVINNDYGLVVKSKARHHAVAAKLDRPVDFKHDSLVVQYEVKFQKPMECGGAYIKLLTDTDDVDLMHFNDQTPYTIMFGPDKCGNDFKLHFIFRLKNPVTGKIEEKHARKPKMDLDRYFSDEKTHLYTLVINADNSFEVYIDQSSVNSGNLLNDFQPPVNPPKEIDDSSDILPDNWDDREKIVDVTAEKPADWDESQPEHIVEESAVKPEDWLDDEPLLIPDTFSEKPNDWDDDMDGEWEPPKIDNPKCKEAPGCGPWTKPTVKNPLYKGKWTSPLISNPNYKGVWKPRRIPNPDYFEDDHPYRNMQAISAVGIELWSMTEDIVFDNFIITHSKKEADTFAGETWYFKKEEERKADPRAQSVIDAIKEVTQGKPWIWIVLIVFVVLPLCLLIGYCCLKSGPSKPRKSVPVIKEAEKSVSEVRPETENAQQHIPLGGKGDLESESSSSKEDEEEDGDEEESEDKEGEEEATEVKVTRRSRAKRD